MNLSLSTNQKSKSQDIFLVITNKFTKIIHFKSVKTMIDVVDLAKIIINVVLRYHGFSKLIVGKQASLLNLKFWFLLCYFFDTKRKLSIIFYLQTDSQIEKQNSIIDVYLRVLINREQNNQARLLSMAKFTYNNTKNKSINNTSLQFNCGYHLRILFKDEVNSCLKSCSANKLAKKLQKLMSICQKNMLHTQKL